MFRKRVDWHKSVSILIMVIGIGFFLFSLIFSGTRFREMKTSDENLETHTDSPFNTVSESKGTDIQGERRLRLDLESRETKRLEYEGQGSENLEEDLKGGARAFELPQTSNSLHNQTSGESEIPNSPFKDDQVETLETEIVALLFEYENAVDQLAILGKEPNADPEVVYKYIVARRETGDQIMHKSVLYQILTGDQGVVLPGGWIYELGKTVGFEIGHE